MKSEKTVRRSSRARAAMLTAALAAAGFGYASRADAGIAVAGDLLVNLDAQSLTAGNLTTWDNLVASQLDFNTVLGTPVVQSVGGYTAVTLNGGAYMQGGLPTAVSGNASRSVEIWAYNPGLAGEETMFGWGYRAGSQNWGLNFGNAAGWGAFTGYDNDLGWATQPTANAWHLITYTFDATLAANQFKVYVDGALNTQKTTTFNTFAGNNFLVGGQYGNTTNGGMGFGFSGSLAQIRVETGVLTDSQIQANFLAGITATLGNPISSVASADWNLTSTWNPAQVPASGDDVTVSGHAITVGTAPATAGTLKLLSGGSVTVLSGQSLSITGGSPLSMDASGGSLVVNSGGTLNIANLNTTAFAGVSLAAGSTLGVTAQLNVNSDMDLSGRNVNFGPTATLSLASNTLTKSDGLTVPVLLAKGGSVNIGGTGMTVTSGLTVTGDFNTAQAASFNASTAAISLQGGTFTLGYDLTAKSLTVNGGAIAMSGKNVAFTDALTMTNGSLNTADAASFTTTAAAITLNGGMLSLGHDLSAASLTLNAGGGITLNGKNVSVANLTINKNLDMGASTLAASNSISASNSVLTLSNVVSTPTLSLTNANLAGTGSVTGVSRYNFQNIAAANPTASAVWGGAGAVMNVGGDSNTVYLSGANSYTGNTILQPGALDAKDGTGLPTASNLQINGGVFQSSGSFVRGLGTGASQVQWTGSGGFSARGGKLTVTMAGAPDPLVWGVTPNFVPAANRLRFGFTTADSEVEFTHAIDLNGASREINVRDNAAANGDFATLSGILSNGGIIKTGAGTLKLPAANTYAGTTEIQGGALQANEGVGLPSASYLYLNGGVLETSGTFSRALGTAAGQVNWNAGGFAAKGSKLTVAVPLDPMASAFVWASTPNFLTGNMVLNSITADQEVEVPATIDLNGARRGIVVNDNPAVTTDFATLSGMLYNGSIDKTGDGKLVMSSAANTVTEFRLNGGSLEFGSSGGLQATSMWLNDGGTTATMNIREGNTVSVNNALYVSGAYDPNQVSVINMTGGTLNAGLFGGGAEWESVLTLGGNAGTGIMNQSGGYVTVGARGVDLGWWDDGAFNQKTIGIYNLDGGTLQTPNVHQGSPWGVGKGYFNFNGGTLVASMSNPTFMQGLTQAVVKEGGAKIDTLYNEVTIAQKLEHGGVAAIDGGLTKLGGGKLTLTGANTYTGPTHVAAGMLSMSGVQTATSGVTVDNYASLSAPADLTVKALTLGAVGTDMVTLELNKATDLSKIIVTNPGGLVVRGSTVLNITGTAFVPFKSYTVLDYTGSWTGSVSQFSAGSGAKGIFIDNPTLTAIQFKYTPDAFKWKGDVSNAWTNTATTNFTWSGALPAPSSTDGNVVIFDDTATGPTAVDLVALGQPSWLAVMNNSKNYTLTSSNGSSLMGNMTLSKDGAGTFVLGIPGNNYSGGTQVNEGVLKLGVAEALPLVANTTVGGGTLDLGGFSQTFAGDPTASLSMLTVSGGQVTNGTVNLTGPLDARSGSVSATVDGTASGSLVKTTAGTFTMSGNSILPGIVPTTEVPSSVGVNIHAGVVNMTGGTLNAKTGKVFVGSAAGDNGTLVMSGNAKLEIHSDGLGNGQDWGYNNGHMLIGTGNVDSKGTVIMSDNASITGEIAWLDVGENSTVGGTLIMSGNSSINVTDPNNSLYGQYSGRVVVAHGNSPGYLKIQDNASITCRSFWFQENNSTVDGRGVMDQLGGTVTMTGIAGMWGGAGAGYYNISGGVLQTIPDPAVANSALSGIVLGRGTGGGATLTISGTGLVDVSRSNDRPIWFSRDGAKSTVNLDGGELRTKVLRMEAAGPAVLNFNGGLLKAYASDGAIGGRPFFSNYLPLNVKAGGAVIDTNGFDISSAQAFMGDATSTGGGLTKKGAGTLTLKAANTYTGTTRIEGGALKLIAPAVAQANTVLAANDVTLQVQSGTAPGAISPATLNSVWTLVRAGYNGPTGAWTGTGITTTAVTNSSLNGLGLVLSGDPAVVPQTLTVREMILGDVNGDNKVTIGDVMVALNSANYQQDGTWLNGDVNYDGKVTIGDVMLMLNSTRYQQDYNPANAPAQIAALEAAGLGSLASAAVPEPATLGLLAVGAMGFLARRRRA